MNIRVTKQFTFDMAHALDGYDGLCKNVHGHTYTLYITLLGPVLNDSESPKNGFVYDFSELKVLVKKEIIDFFDHSLLLNSKSQLAKQNWIQEYSNRVHFTNYQPSCENILIDIVMRVKGLLPNHLTLITVRLNETPSSYAEWHTEDNL